jgi:hypothetical protein
MKNLLTVIFLITLFSSNSIGRNKEEYAIIQGDTFFVVNFTLKRNDLFFADSCINQISTLKNGKYIFIDSLRKIRAVATVFKGRLCDTLIQYDATGALFGVCIYDEQYLRQGYYYSKDCILGTYIEFPDTNNLKYKVIYTYDDIGRIHRVLYFQGYSIVKSRKLKLKINRMHKRVYFCPSYWINFIKQPIIWH